MKKNILFLVWVILLLVFISFFGYSTYQYYRAIHADDPIDPYLRVSSGSVTIVRHELAIDMTIGDRYNLMEKDILITGHDGLAMIHWPDRSITRIGSESRMVITRMHTEEDYSRIEISYDLEKWKVWNTVIRTLYPGSYFEVQLPKNHGTIAGVRGTVFEINLDRNYIHSVDHSVHLTNILGQAVTLLPGELVEATDILKKLTQATLDRAWWEYNRVQDNAERLLQSVSIEKSLERLNGTFGLGSFWDGFVRFFLKQIPLFSDIRLMEQIRWIWKYTPESISIEDAMHWYQHLQDTKFIQERESIRILLEKEFQNQSSGSIYIEALARSALWDRMSFSGMELKSADIYINMYAKEVDKKIQWVLRVIPASELQNKARETLRSLLR
jgi:hypothetical protein